MRKIFVLFLCCVSLISCEQKNKLETTEKQTKKTEKFQVLAKFISNEGGDKVWTIKYEVLKNLSNHKISDTIKVGFYNYKTYKGNQEVVLLNLENYTLQKTKDYYIFPEYDANKGIEKAKVNFIAQEYWENCETGKECEKINLKRNTKKQKWFLIMPCGGTETEITLRKDKVEKPILKTHIGLENCPPYFELTELKDGKYIANMISCGLGGTIELNIETEK